SLSEDHVAQILVSPHREALVHELRQNASRPVELETLIQFIHSRLRPTYRRSLEKRLTELIPDSKEKAQIAEVTRSWITQLMNEGFSPGSIFYSVAQRFFSVEATPKIADVSELNEFFGSFGAEPSGWEVTFKVSPSFKRLEAVARELSISLDEKAPPTKSKTPYAREKTFRERNPKGLL